MTAGEDGWTAHSSLVMTEGLELWDSHWPSIIDSLLEGGVQAYGCWVAGRTLGWTDSTTTEKLACKLLSTSVQIIHSASREMTQDGPTARWT